MPNCQKRIIFLFIYLFSFCSEEAETTRKAPDSLPYPLVEIMSELNKRVFHNTLYVAAIAVDAG